MITMDTVQDVKKEIMSLCDITNINNVNIDLDHLDIEINLPTNNDIINDFMEMSKTINIDLQKLSFIETTSLFNIVDNSIKNTKRDLLESDNDTDIELVKLVTKFVSTTDIIIETQNEDEEFIEPDYDSITSQKQEHKREEKKREQSRKAGVMRKEFLTGTGKFSDKPNKKDEEY